MYQHCNGFVHWDGNVYCYALTPIDVWSGTMTREELLAQPASAELREGGLDRFRELAQVGFRRLGWEGDTLVEAYFTIPQPPVMMPCMGVKQSNNGSTFVASAVPLPWLDAESEGVGGWCIVNVDEGVIHASADFR